MTRRSKPTGIFADPRDGIMVRFENNRHRKITEAERRLVVESLSAAPGEPCAWDRRVHFPECETPEPTLRQMVHAYYRMGLNPDLDKAKEYAERYIASTSGEDHE